MINKLSSLKNSVNISEIKTGTNVINTPTELTETFNLHFSTVGKNLAADIPNENIELESYIIQRYLLRPNTGIFRTQRKNRQSNANF